LHTLSSRTLSLPRTLAAGAGLALLLLAAAGAAAARSAHAATPISVNTLADGKLDSGATTCVSTPAAGKCTLRAAIALNEANGGGSAITLDLPAPGQITLTLGQLVITKSVSITGAGLATNAVVSDGKDRVFFIESLAAQVAMSGFTITGGKAPQSLGGGIFNGGNLTLTGVDVQGNTAGFGGGVADVGALTLQPGTVVTKNTALRYSVENSTEGGIGGGIAEFATLVATGAVISSNSADDSGGNLAFFSAQVGDNSRVAVSHATGTVTQSTIADGKAVFGGGAWLLDASATFTASTFVGNAVAVDEGDNAAGGAIESDCGALTLVNDTLDANTADSGFGGAIAQSCFVDDLRAGSSSPNNAGQAFGRRPATPTISLAHGSLAAVAVSPSPTPAPLVATAAIDFVTMADNTAGVLRNVSHGSTMANQGDASTITVHDTIVAKKSGDTGKDCVLLSNGGKQTITSQGYNLESANDCSFGATGDQTSVSPQLGALAGNGGPTQTMALSAGTPAVDTADPKCDVTTDQRGISRPQPVGGRCDIGAFELQVAATTPTPLPSPPVTGHGPAGGPSFLLLILALLALPLVGAGLLIARSRTA
jgi:hypothetical protein